MSEPHPHSHSSLPPFELLAGLTARLASTASLEEIVEMVVGEIIALGFSAVWMAQLNDDGHLLTLKEMIDGVDTTDEMPTIFMLDMRQPIGHGFREGRMINIADPDSLFIIEDDDTEVPDGVLALPRVIYEHLRGHPFACGPLLGSRGQPVGALGLSSYRGKQPIPDTLFGEGLLRAFMNHLGIAMERAMHVARLERVNAQLLEAQATIERDARIKAVGELAAAVAHDLNNLSGIALLAVSAGERSPEAASDVLPRIARATRAIGDLVGRLQRIARADRGQVPALANVAEIVDDILVMVAPLLREASIEVDAQTPPVPPVAVDATLLHQVILNLVLNARDALLEMPSAGRTLRLRLRDDEGLIRLLITDTGPGLAPEVMRSLFRPFVSTKGGSHAGIGLAAGRASLEHFGGRLEARNAPGGGAVFELTLSAAVADAVSVPAKTPPEPAGTESAKRLLAVDDDPDVVFIINAFLEPLGHQVVTVTSASEALSLAAREHFDVILCDVGMPEKSGLDVAEELRRIGYQGKLVLMTGWDAEQVRSDRRSTACDAILKKPFVGEELRALLGGVLFEQ